MKKLLLFLFVLIVFSCHKNSPAPNPTEGNIVLKITNKVNGKIFALNQKYVTPANDTFYVTNYKYYISNLQLMNIDNGKYIAVPNSYYLFNAAEQSIIPLGASNISPGDYNEILFSIGIDDVRNHTGAQTGALDATLHSDMFWSWNAGYKFFVLEGQIRNGNRYSPFVFHIGSDDNFKTETFNSFSKGWNTDINIQAGGTSEVDVTFNLDSLFKGISPDSLNIMSGSQAATMANNYATMPQLTGISNQ